MSDGSIRVTSSNRPEVRGENLGHRESSEQEPGQRGTDPVDFAYLATQTFHDVALQREVLALFVDQARRLIPTLPDLSPRQQGEIAHLLKGSARGIGAWAAAEEAALFEAAEAPLRPARARRLAGAFERAETAILARLAETHEDGAP